MKLQLAGPKQPELAAEIRIRQQLHGFQHTAEALCRNHMRDGTIVAGHRDEGSVLSGMDGRGGLPLKILNAVCIFHW